MKISIASFYRFANLTDRASLRNHWLTLGDRAGIKGTILIAPEGINATIAGSREALTALLDEIQSTPGLGSLTIKWSAATALPFLRFKVRIKKELIGFGEPELAAVTEAGHVAPDDWNALIAGDDVTLIDVRNAYEIRIGSFAHAIDPGTADFNDFKDFVRNKLDPETRPRIAMFCTGGIRCEKAAAWMGRLGFDDIYQLDGGILNYMAKVPGEASRFTGDCYVFDQRLAVGPNLEPADYVLCPGCREPVSSDEQLSDKYEIGAQCPGCFGTHTPTALGRYRERARQIMLAQRRNRQHLGPGEEPRQG